ncbi:MAG TPA: efflux RND transporter periplasmic adaptor subunit [Terriglobales bacterium]
MRVVQDAEMENLAGSPSMDQQFRGKQPKGSARWWLLLFAVVTAVGIIVGAVLPRIQARANLRRETDEMAVPTVSVVKPKRAAPADELVLPANVQAFADSPIYARTNGYLRRWYADIGAHVRKGQLLADIETPEVDQQLMQARADLGTAQANLRLSQITAERYTGLLKTDSVSKQEADNAEGDYAAKKAALEAAQANVKRLEELQSFEKIYAPFDGIITARNTDIGNLIDSGSSGGARTELFHVAQPDKLRVYVNVPEAYSQSAKPGLKAALTVPEYPGKRFEGTLVRTADAIDPATRTLLVEVDVNNPTGTLLSGAYAAVHFNLPTVTNSYTLPVNALLFRAEGLRVAAVDNGHADLRPITIGHDFGSEVEVVAGLNGDESIIVNPPDSLISGEPVRIAEPSNKGGEVR